jgi:hypothetical protein
MTIQNSGTLYRECEGIYDIIVVGNAVIDKCPAPVVEYTMTIKAADLDGKPINGEWMVVRSFINSEIVAKGFTPLNFVGLSNTTYTITESQYGGKVFDHWEQDGIIKDDSDRLIRLSSDTTFTVVYDTSRSIRGFTSLTYTGAQEEPDLTVQAQSVDGSKTLHMWTIIDPQSSNDTSTTYKVYASNYKDRVFDHWEDGSTSRTRTLTIEEATTITAYYQTAISTVSFSAHYHDVDGPGTPMCDDVISGTCGPFFGNAEKSSSGVVTGSWFEGLPRGALCNSGGPISEMSTDGTTFEISGTYTGSCDSHEVGGAVTVIGECGPNSEISFTIGGVENRFIGDSTCSSL